MGAGRACWADAFLRRGREGGSGYAFVLGGAGGWGGAAISPLEGVWIWDAGSECILCWEILHYIPNGDTRVRSPPLAVQSGPESVRSGRVGL